MSSVATNGGAAEYAQTAAYLTKNPTTIIFFK